MTDQTTTTPATTPATTEPELLTAAEGAKWVQNGAVLIDVRSQPTRERVGGIAGAIVVDRERLTELFGAESPERLTEVHSAEHPIVVVCGSVAGSQPVADWLVEHGHTAVAHVDGGFESWKAAGQPTTPGTES